MLAVTEPHVGTAGIVTLGAWPEEVIVNDTRDLPMSVSMPVKASTHV